MFKAKHIMNKEALTVRADDKVDHAMMLMLERATSGLPVVDEAGCLVGVISESDLLRLVCDCWPPQDRVSDYMSAETCVVDLDTDWIAMADLFRASGLRVMPVTHRGQLVGVVSRRSLLQTILNARRLVREVLAQENSPNCAEPQRAMASTE